MTRAHAEDVAEIATLIKKASLCGFCLARRLGRSRMKVDRALRRINVIMKVTCELGSCASCLGRRVVHRML